MTVAFDRKEVGAYPGQHREEEKGERGDEETQPLPEKMTRAGVAENHPCADGEQNDAEAAEKDDVKIRHPPIWKEKRHE